MGHANPAQQGQPQQPSPGAPRARPGGGPQRDEQQQDSDRQAHAVHFGDHVVKPDRARRAQQRSADRRQRQLPRQPPDEQRESAEQHYAPGCRVEAGGSGRLDAQRAQREREQIAQDGEQRVAGVVNRPPDVERHLNLGHVFDVFVVEDVLRAGLAEAAADVRLERGSVQPGQGQRGQPTDDPAGQGGAGHGISKEEMRRAHGDPRQGG